MNSLSHTEAVAPKAWSTPQSEVQCKLCREWGHWKKDCPYRHAQVKNNRKSEKPGKGDKTSDKTKKDETEDSSEERNLQSHETQREEEENKPDVTEEELWKARGAAVDEYIRKALQSMTVPNL